MLLKCPECELPVSDKALICPHGGYPLVKDAKPLKKKSKKLRDKNFRGAFIAPLLNLMCKITIILLGTSSLHQYHLTLNMI